MAVIDNSVHDDQLKYPGDNHTEQLQRRSVDFDMLVGRDRLKSNRLPADIRVY